MRVCPSVGQLTKNLDRARIEQVVRSHGWLSQTPETFQSQVLANCDLLNLKAGQSLYRAGDESGGVFGVVEGMIAVSVPPHDSRSSLAYVAGPGFWIGDVAAVRGGKRLVTIHAVSRCRLLRLPRAELQRIVGKDPVCWSYMALLLAQNFARSIRLIAALKQVNPRDRVAGGAAATDGRYARGPAENHRVAVEPGFGDEPRAPAR